MKRREEDVTIYMAASMILAITDRAFKAGMAEADLNRSDLNAYNRAKYLERMGIPEDKAIDQAASESRMKPEQLQRITKRYEKTLKFQF